MKSREVQLVKFPQGLPQQSDFCIETISLQDPEAGEVQVRNTWMSVDPYMRGQMRGKDTYVPGFKLREALTGGAVGVVTASKSQEFAEGDTVHSWLGWREAFNAPGAYLRKVDVTKLPPETYLAAAGMTGMTAYVGLRLADLTPGDVVFISAAAGATGSVACQIAKLKGAVVIGSAGGPEKCKFLRKIGVDFVIDYKSTENLEEALKQAAPNGLDVYFDNVGGTHLAAAVQAAKPQAGIIMCGYIASYNEDSAQPQPQVAALGKDLKVKSFLVSDYFHLMPAFLTDMTEWITAGRIVSKETVDVGIEQAVPAFLKLFSGENIGKMLVRLAG